MINLVNFCNHMHFSQQMSTPAGVIFEYFAHLKLMLRTRTYFTHAFCTRDLVEKGPTLQSWSGADSIPKLVHQINCVVSLYHMKSQERSNNCDIYYIKPSKKYIGHFVYSSNFHLQANRSCHMVVNVTWLSMSHGCQCHMVVNVTWLSMSHGCQCHMVVNVTWLSISTTLMSTHTRQNTEYLLAKTRCIL